LCQWHRTNSGRPCPPFYNFAIIPKVTSRDAFWKTKQDMLNNNIQEKPHYEDIHMPKNTGIGFMIATFSLVFGFALVWHITWLAIVGFVGMIACVIFRSFDNEIDYYVKADEVEKLETEILNRNR
jgi:cytochrome o ubiquinol oxidase subunit 1